MDSEISLLAAIIWAVVSGLIGVGIGVTAMCAFYLSKRADEATEETLRRLSMNIKKPTCIIFKPYLSDLAKGKAAKENMR